MSKSAFAPATPTPLSPTRELAFDAYKGVAILAVILHHVSGMGIRFTSTGTASHAAAVFTNRLLLFCVPAFLFLTVFLVGRGLARRPMPVVEFWRKRFPRILIPYLIWSAFYLLYNTATGPGTLSDLMNNDRWFTWLAYGKANYHLYFLVIVLQIYVVLPGIMEGIRRRGEADPVERLIRLNTAALVAALLLVFTGEEGVRSLGEWMPRLMQWAGWAALAAALYLLTEILAASAARWKLGFWHWLLLAYGLQIGANYLHKVAIKSAYPATLLLTYFVPVLMGVWMAMNFDAFRKNWVWTRWPLGALALGSWVVFSPLALRLVDGQPVSPFLYQATYTAFTGSALLWLFGAAVGMAEKWPRVSEWLALPGAYSMELYLIHPALLSQITPLSVQGSPVELALYIGIIFLDLTLVTLLIAMLLRRIGLGGLLFGR